MKEFLDGLGWRLVGPYRGGRVVAVAGHPDERATFYFGSTGGGVWRTTDAGDTWKNLSDGYFRRASVGAIALAPSEPGVIYVGMGECCIRNTTSHGDGVWRSVDGGLSWSHLGLEATRHIARVRVHPNDPETVYVAALGHAHGPNEERGVYRSRDGGSNWDRVLYRDQDTGAADLAIDPRNPRILYATLWQTRRTPWRLDSGGPGSGLWRSTDGGDTWEDLSRRPGLPKGTLGRIGVAPSGAQAGRVWAIVEAEDGAVFRSDDYGEHWQRLSEKVELRGRAFYYTHIFADPNDAETVWVLNMELFRSSDGGKTFTSIPVQHGDCHDLWIDPRDSRRMILGDDGGANITLDGSASWSTLYNQPTAELYHVTTDTRQPYRIYAAQQDNTTIAFDNQSRLGAITQISLSDVGGGESGHIAIPPERPDIVYAGSYKGLITRVDQGTGERRSINVWPEEFSAADEARYRFNWCSPILLSCHDSKVLYHAGNRLFRSTDEGRTWTAVSPDLTYNDPEKLRSSGGITIDNSGAEFYCTIFALAESPLQQGLLWAGTDDGRVHVTRDGGETWTEVTPPDLPKWATVRLIDASTHEAGTAHVAVDGHKLDDFKPYLFRTRDFGATWERLDGGLDDNEYCHVLREDPVRRGLLFLGTEVALRVSFDDGKTWHLARGEFPQTPVHDLVFKGDDLIVATHGRGIWVLEDLPALRQHEEDHDASAVHLYQPRTQVRWFTVQGFPARGEGPRSYTHPGSTVISFDKVPVPGRSEIVTQPSSAGRNPTDGVAVLYHLQDPGEDELRLTFLDAEGNEVRALVAKPGDEDRKPEKGKFREVVPPRRAGLNRFVWDGRHGRGTTIEVDPPEDLDSVDNPGPQVPPGRYKVRLEIGGQQREAGFEIAADPRSTATAEEQQQQYELDRRLWGLLSDLYGGVNRARTARRELGDGEDRKEKVEALAAAEDELVGPGGGRRSLFIAPARLDTKLKALRRTAGGGPPTAAALKVADELSQRVGSVVERIASVT